MGNDLEPVISTSEYIYHWLSSTLSDLKNPRAYGENAFYDDHHLPSSSREPRENHDENDENEKRENALHQSRKLYRASGRAHYRTFGRYDRVKHRNSELLERVLPLI